MSFELNKYQEKAVTYYGEKPLLIEAGPGSGKTRVITERVKFLINEKEMDPESFLIITFSNKAANELKERLREDFPQEIIDLMQISTVHSFCYKLLLENTKVPYKILDDDTKTRKNMFIYENREKLGFVREATLTRGKVSDVVNAFDKYSTFDVDTDCLVKWIEENEPVSKDYKDFINEEFNRTGRFPRKKIQLDSDKKNKKRQQDSYHAYADSWYNALHLQVAKAYPLYRNLLEENNLIDFNVLQIKALEYLRENPQTKYRNILVDEFQDTDPVQVEIFRILMEYALSEIDVSRKDELIASNGIKASFTAVGDVDQSIYGFRGAVENYFEEFDNDYDIERLGLNVNYRSTDEIIDLSERFISKQRDSESKKHLESDRKESRNVYYMESSAAEDEAESIASLVIHLKETGVIEKYSDVAILLRSVINSSKFIINEFKLNRIPFQVKGLGDLEKKDEILSVLTLLHFLVDEDDPDKKPLFTGWEKDGNNLKGFTNENFNQRLFTLSPDTQSKIIIKQNEFEDDAFELAKDLYPKLNDGARMTKRSFGGLFDLEEEFLDELFKLVKKPFFNEEGLKDMNITDKKDLEFFEKLNDLKSRIFGVPYDERPTILEVFYELLEICGYIDEDFIYDEDNEEALGFISLFTQIIYEYENIIGNQDIRGLYWFLNSNIRNYSYDIDNEDGVNILTVHKSKGLEFPVVIIAGLNDFSFPKNYENLKDSKYSNGSAVYYTPRVCFKNKSLKKDDVLLHMEEEERIIYVAMTRARDILVLSKNHKKSRKKSYSQVLAQENERLEEIDRKNRMEDDLDDLHGNDVIGDLEGHDDIIENDEIEDIENIYYLSPKEESSVIKDLRCLERELNSANINSIQDLRDIDIIRDKALLNQINDPDHYMKLDALLRIKGYEDIESIEELEAKEEFDERTYRLILRVHSRNLQKYNHNIINLIENHKALLKNTLENSNDLTEVLLASDIELSSFKPAVEPRKDNEKKTVKLSYSSIELYETCPLLYDIRYNKRFRVSDNIFITYGNISHNALEEINNRILENKANFAVENGIEIDEIDEYLEMKGIPMDNNLFITEKEIERIVNEIYWNTPNIDHSSDDLAEVLDYVFSYWDEYGRSFEILDSEYPFEITKEDYILRGAIDLIYKTKDGLVILDYKTTENVHEAKLNKYAKQLNTYAFALKQDPKYKDMDISSLKIYAIKSKEMYIIDLKEENITKRGEDIGEIAKSISNKEFKSNGYDEYKCQYCDFKFICRS